VGSNPTPSGLTTLLKIKVPCSLPCSLKGKLVRAAGLFQDAYTSKAMQTKKSQIQFLNYIFNYPSFN
jgi:hypothetical protein